MTGSTAETGATVDTGPPEVDVDLDLFPRDRVLEVQVEMAAADWDALRFQDRTIVDMFTGPECLDGPFESPYTEFPAELAIDGVAIPSVTVRKKGFIGSADGTRPSLKLDVDDLVPRRDVGGFDKITLNNQLKDASGIRTCLAAEALVMLGVPASRCALAHVTVNGQDLGLYAHVEDVEEGVLPRARLDGGQVYEGTMSDFDPGFLLTFEPETPETDPELALPRAVMEALTLPDDELADALAPLVDFPAVNLAWAAESMLGLRDGFSANRNNFVAVWPPDSGLVIVPTALEASFGFEGDSVEDAQLIATDATFFWRLQTVRETREAFLDTLDDALARWDEAALHAEIDRVSALAAPFVDAAALAEAVAQSDAFVDGREAEVRTAAAELDDPRRPTITPFPCFTPGGGISLTFDTTFDTLAEPPTTGSSLVTSPDGVFHGGSVAGRSDEYVLVRLVSQVGRVTTTVELQLDEPLAEAAPTTVHMGTTATYGTYTWTNGLGGSVVGYLGGGDLVLGAWDTTPGAPIRGSFVGTLSLLAAP